MCDVFTHRTVWSPVCVLTFQDEHRWQRERERAFPSILGGLLELGCGLEGWGRSGPLSQSTTLGLGGD